MKVVWDIEANGLENPTSIWLVVLKDIDTGEYHRFRNITSDAQEKERFLDVAVSVTQWIGHNSLGYDVPILVRLCPEFLPYSGVDLHLDTLVVSKLMNYSKKGKHSIKEYGQEFGMEKGDFSDYFTGWSPEMEDYCVRDVDICHRIWSKYSKHILHPAWAAGLRMEHEFQIVANQLQSNGFSFNADRARSLLKRISAELAKLDLDILEAFPPREVLIREFTPRATKFGTISKSSVPRTLQFDISSYEVGKTYRHTRLEEFNPSSHRQIITVLNEAGWRPTNRTATHIDAERSLQRLKYGRREKSELDRAEEDAIILKLQSLKVTGWKVDEENLATLPDTAPAPARLLAKRILLESRRRTLTEWLGLVKEDGRIHGRFYGIGAWTHRMAHQNPNTANIPTDAKLYGAEMRALWQAPKNRLLVGVDAEGIQLRIFAHYIDDKDFTKALVEGKKDDKSDPHSLNQRVLGAKSRNIAKRFIFAYLLGGGLGKLSQILECDEQSARNSLDRLLERYTGLALLKETVIPQDAKRGYFKGLDGRLVRLPGDTPGERKHLCMSGYLQNGEAVVMKKACLKWAGKLTQKKALLVNFVHDEWQTECPNNMEIALEIAKIQAESLREVGEELGLKCPLAGSFYSEDNHDYTIGTKWSVTH